MKHNCEQCTFRRKYETKPTSILGRIWKWHTKFCPGWKAYFQSQSKEKQEEIKDRLNL